mmetsp:Transcript_2114/g.8214  ORF Transcript_2114/g.8214 Transcript_2114/m.8214 type:complete len:203 (-) Transcript_2114:596-1204(-)
MAASATASRALRVTLSLTRGWTLVGTLAWLGMRPRVTRSAARRWSDATAAPILPAGMPSCSSHKKLTEASTAPWSPLAALACALWWASRRQTSRGEPPPTQSAPSTDRTLRTTAPGSASATIRRAAALAAAEEGSVAGWLELGGPMHPSAAGTMALSHADSAPCEEGSRAAASGAVPAAQTRFERELDVVVWWPAPGPPAAA